LGTVRPTQARARALNPGAAGQADNRGRAVEVSIVRDLLREHLLGDGRRRGYRLPDEHVLAREAGCSRNVLREALALLVADGILRRERGRGTHVLTTSPAISIDQGLDLDEAMRADVGPAPAAEAVGYQVLRVGQLRVPPLLAGLLGSPAGTPAVHIERLVIFEQRPVGHWDLYLTGVRAGPPLAGLAGREKAEPLLRGAGLRPRQEEIRVEAITPSPRTADLLYRGERGQPTLRVTRRFYGSGERVLAIAIGRCAWPAAAFSVVRNCADALPSAFDAFRIDGGEIIIRAGTAKCQGQRPFPRTPDILRLSHYAPRGFLPGDRGGPGDHAGPRPRADRRAIAPRGKPHLDNAGVGGETADRPGT
jgi:DNA-binding GntR family transcriptional regulator